MALPPGQYMLRLGIGRVTQITDAYIQVPFALNFFVPPDSVVYLGHVEATMRPWSVGDFLAGPSQPWLAQKMLGVTQSSFDVVVQDRTASDITQMRSDFPMLIPTPIKVEILPPFDRGAARKLWLTTLTY